MSRFDRLVRDIRLCRKCVEAPESLPLPHEPRPVFQASPLARLGIYGQAPGTKVHASGAPFTDASGERLRAWLGIDSEIFYDSALVAIAPMGFCFPGQDERGGDLPPRRECAPLWRDKLLGTLTGVRTAVLVGSYAQAWHLKKAAKPTLTETVAAWREYAPAYFPTPHPSWRNNGWLRKNPWFETDVLPALRAAVRAAIKG